MHIFIKTGLDLWTFKPCNVVECMGWDGHLDGIVSSLLCVFWQNNMASPVENTSWNPWKCHFPDTTFQNVPRCLSPQELVPLAQVPKLLTIFIINLLLKNFLTALDIVILLCVVFNLFWCNCMDQFKYTDCILVLGKILLVLCRKRNANVSNIGWWSVRPCGNYRCTKILTYPYTIINYFVLLPCGL